MFFIEWKRANEMKVINVVTKLKLFSEPVKNTDLNSRLLASLSFE